MSRQNKSWKGLHHPALPAFQRPKARPSKITELIQRRLAEEQWWYNALSVDGFVFESAFKPLIGKGRIRIIELTRSDIIMRHEALTTLKLRRAALYRKLAHL